MTQALVPAKRQWQGAGLLVVAGLCFAFVNTINQHLGMVLGASTPAITFWQYSIAALMFAPWLWANRAHLRNGLTKLQLVRVGAGAIGVQFWVASLAHVPIWQAIALLLLSPLFVTVGAGLFLGERVGPRRMAAVVLGGIGGAIILEPWSDAFSFYATWPIVAAALWASVSLVTKRMTATHSAESLTAYLLLLLIPINALVSVLTPALNPGVVGFGLPVEGVYYVIAAGALVGLAQYLIAGAYTRADAAFLQPFDHIKLLFNIGLYIAVFQFAPPGILYIGVPLILIAVMILERE